MWESSLVLVGAALWDFVIGDPWSWPHPVQLMGWIISSYSAFVFKYCPSALGQKLYGILLTGLLLSGSGALTWLILWACEQIALPLRIFVEITMLASCFAGRSLRDAAEDVLTPLSQGNINEARSRLSRYVGRETQHLAPSEILRAVLETISENAVDGVMAPLFYALIGFWLPLIGPVPCAMAYKAVSTLDSMIGYRTQPYTDLGWCSAKADDLLTWFPCRLTVMSLMILSKQPRTVWKLCQRDASQDPSPNSGWSECAYAASLGVRLGGENTYRGEKQFKPFVGDPLHSISPVIIAKGLNLTRACFILWMTLSLLFFAAFSHG